MMRKIRKSRELTLGENLALFRNMLIEVDHSFIQAETCATHLSD